ncbi:PTS ascorbate-specific transporter subunit IIA [Testudinibacter sp. TR-2022]|uniref:PTS sugar transporter subunit IIA n=1 Tax=Testudinibacter sp. TR-2022 TaxID=2585029 RepID=UPI00111B317E|nr:PTS sugar transporter subunit IIA [Testudinibacter sp. TR-2022]TNG93921.1 PTS ascorbate-specific transporter subunit IIA [Pasteurellaceae bacterium UScroc12]TNG95693.1 PTS ascorbate-specific transporter subunit IIA [Pasteurellaceae bacterium USgator41]TNG96751.1 PTS ascorbate-specific transporter subunit IIA [Pasteurellaceae bacterium UScroc31]TNH00115.1 PTS ascorbate-specific transporter subunit IIA [Pasteurellaceae bacterium USgator11]TNH02919.1 PTS ascorbate-specific transporter subunit 
MNLKQSLIDNDSIKLNQQATDWQAAIKIGTDMLVKSGAVEVRYHNAIVDSIKKLGPYIILAPGLAMPHARPEDGVNKTAFALVTLSTPVTFEGEETPVDVLITLAGSDSNQHMQGLMEITQILEDEESESGVDLEKIKACQTKEEIYQVIDQALNK